MEVAQECSQDTPLDPKHLKLNGVARSFTTCSGWSYSSFKPECTSHISVETLQQGLGFEPLLGVRGQHFSARYGPRPSVKVSFSKAAQDPWPARGLALNRYLLDDANPDGTLCQYRQGGKQFPGNCTVTLGQIGKQDLVRIVVEEAVSVRVCQLFLDGNHRTAILSIYEKLADAGWWLDMSAVDLYILISNRNQVEWNSVKHRMVKAILQHLKHFPDIPFQAREVCAGQVKLIAEINTLFDDVHDFLSLQGSGMDSKRKKWRSFCRRSKKRHAQYISLYHNPQIK